MQVGERVYFFSHGIRRLGTVEVAAPKSLKVRVRIEGEPEPKELLTRRLFPAPPELEQAAGRFLQRDHATSPGDTAIDPLNREASFIASDGTTDRFGDVLEPGGWDLKSFKRNPQFLWQHDVRTPIGTVPSIRVKDDRLVARVRFIEQGVSTLADQLFKLVQIGQLCAVSIGARALTEPEPIRDKHDNITGFLYKSMELLELSLVSVPANPNALLVGRSLGLEEGLLSEAFESDASVANLKGYYDHLRASTKAPELLSRRVRRTVT